MFARMTELHSTDEREIDRDLRYFEDQILARIEELPGMCGGLVLLDRTGGHATAITFWDDREALEGSAEVADTLRQLAFQRMNLASEPVVRECEVKVAKLVRPVAPVNR